MSQRYKPIEEIGNGAESIVYKVIDTEDNNTVYV